MNYSEQFLAEAEKRAQANENIEIIFNNVYSELEKKREEVANLTKNYLEIEDDNAKLEVEVERLQRILANTAYLDVATRLADEQEASKSLKEDHAKLTEEVETLRAQLNYLRATLPDDENDIHTINPS